MKAIKKVFEITVDMFDETGVDFNSFVSEPAHRQVWDHFAEQKVEFFANEEEQIVTGVMIFADILIPRYDKELGKYHVFFSPKTIKDIVYKFNKNNFINNVNLQHNPQHQAEGVVMIESFIVDKAKGISPKNLGDVRDGSWIASYKINDPRLWEKVKNKEIMGFSVEGLFSHKLREEFQTNNKQMKKENKSIREILFGSSEKAHKFGSVTSDDGTVLNYEGEELVVGSMMTVDVDGEQMPAPEGAYSLTGDMEGKSVVLDATGAVMEIIETPQGENNDEIIEAIIEEMKAQKVEMSALKTENKELKEKLSSFSEKFETFAKQPAEAPKAMPKAKRDVNTPANPLLNKYLK